MVPHWNNWIYLHTCKVCVCNTHITIYVFYITHIHTYMCTLRHNGCTVSYKVSKYEEFWYGNIWNHHHNQISGHIPHRQVPTPWEPLRPLLPVSLQGSADLLLSLEMSLLLTSHTFLYGFVLPHCVYAPLFIAECVLLDECTTACLSTHLFTDTWVFFRFLAVAKTAMNIHVEDIISHG